MYTSDVSSKYTTNHALIPSFFLAVVILAIPASPARGAIGCTLSNPAEDLKYLYPALTSYREDLKELSRYTNGPALFAALQERLGTDLDPVYETFETPYTLYSIFKGDQVVGYVHGVNVPGQGGVIQLFLAVDPATGAIARFFFQRLESREAKALRARPFTAAFAGLSLADFYKFDYFRRQPSDSIPDAVTRLKELFLLATGKPDHEATLRGVRKNLILLDIFVFGRRSEPFYQRAREALNATK